MNHATKLKMDNVVVPVSPFKLLPVTPPGIDPIASPARPGFPLNGSRSVEIDLMVNAGAVAVTTVTVKFFLFDNAPVTDGVNYGPLPPGTAVPVIPPIPLLASYIQVELSGFGAPTLLDFVRIAGR